MRAARAGELMGAHRVYFPEDFVCRELLDAAQEGDKERLAGLEGDQRGEGADERQHPRLIAPEAHREGRPRSAQASL